MFAVAGSAAMHLLYSLGTNKEINNISTHHEQAVAMAAEGNARITGKSGAALVTSGPCGTNALTGVCGAWIDSIPVIFVMGLSLVMPIPFISSCLLSFGFFNSMV